jgi:hypothetical protein
MPNRYEREIEEILRNLESTEPKASFGQKFGKRLRRKQEYRVKPRQRSFSAPHFKATDWLIIIAVIAALIAGGYAYANNGEATVVTGILAIVSAICLVLLILSPFLFRSRQSPQSTRYGNVTPIRRNPLSSIATRWNLFLLRMRYRRKNGR